MSVIALRTTATSSGPIHLLGTLVDALPDGQYLVEDEAGLRWSSRRAASCLLRPEPGDTVMLSGPDADRTYLIAVLVQANASACRVEAPGDLVLAARGSVAIESAADIGLHGVGQLRMQAARWALQAQDGEAQVERMRYTGQAVDATIGKLRLLGKWLETVTDRVMQMARNSVRVVDETEKVRDGHLDCEAVDTVRMHGHHTVVTGKALVKVDAAQIHMG